jgi:ankyrin repeat protein
MLKLLIANRADVNPKDNQGRRPLWFAKDRGYKEIMELLNKHEAK